MPDKDEKNSFSAQLSERFLSRLKPDVSDGTGKWIGLLNNDPSSTQAPEAKETDGKPVDWPTLKLLEKMFDEFQRYVPEYNKRVAAPEQISMERPHSFTRNEGYGQITNFWQAHIVSAEWALIIQGLAWQIQCYIIEADLMLGFEENRSSYEAIFEMNFASSPAGSVWKVEDRVVTHQSFPTVCKEIFAKLVRVTKGGAEELEKLFPQDESQVVEQAVPSFYRQQDGFELLKPETPSYGNQNQLQQGYPNQMQQMQPQMVQQQNYPPQQYDTMQPGSQTIAPQGSLQHAIEMMIVTVDENLAQLSADGARAFQAQDLNTVDLVMKRTAALRDFRSRFVKLAQESLAPVAF